MKRSFDSVSPKAVELLGLPLSKERFSEGLLDRKAARYILLFFPFQHPSSDLQGQPSEIQRKFFPEKCLKCKYQ